MPDLASNSTLPFLKYAVHLRTAPTEKVLVLFLDNQLQLLTKLYITQDHQFQTELCARSVYAPAVVHDAKNIVLIHNHPSGCVEPSSADYLTTMVLAQAGVILQIKLLDHIIVTSDNYYSFRKAGVL